MLQQSHFLKDSSAVFLVAIQIKIYAQEAALTYSIFEENFVASLSSFKKYLKKQSTKR